MASPTASSSSPAVPEEEEPAEETGILQAARSGNLKAMKDTVLGDPAALLATTPEGNTCLHIACMEGHTDFCDQVVAIKGSLLAAVNRNGETPLIIAVQKGHGPLASQLLRWCRLQRMNEAVLKQDKDGCNALHHAIILIHKHKDDADNGPRMKKLALELIETEPALSRGVNKANESPMFLAVRTGGCKEVFDKLVGIRGSSNMGGQGPKALRASVVVGEGSDSNNTGDENAGAATQYMVTTTAAGRDLMKAAKTGDSAAPLLIGSVVLCGTTTPVGNTCLHIASLYGHEGFCRQVLEKVGDAGSLRLLTATNADGETPLLTAVKNGHASLASFFLDQALQCSGGAAETERGKAILRQDKDECNTLHHAIRSGFRSLAIELIAQAPALSRAVNRYGESPMFIAVMRDYEDVSDELLQLCDSAHAGACGHNALHAAVRNGNSGIARKIMQRRPQLAREEDDKQKQTPMHLAVVRDQVGVLSVLLELDPSLGYVVCSDGTPLLNIAAIRGQVNAAQEILERCPDTPCATQSGKTCLHQAVDSDQLEFVNFVIRSPQLRKLVNMRDENGLTALHLSVTYCRPKMLRALLRHSDIDVTMLDRQGYPPTWLFGDAINNAKSLHWNEVSMLLLSADPKRETNIYNLHKEIKDKITDRSRKNVKPLTETYTRNTSIVAILMASITFAAAFTLSGWYRNNDAAASRGPKRSAFQAFLIFDILAMCCSLSVAFICVTARWEDFEFLLYYRSVTVKIMWLAYVATIAAFATGLYTVLAPQLPWAAIAICCLPFLVPLFTWVFGTWHVLKLQLRLGRKFKSDLLDMV